MRMFFQVAFAAFIVHPALAQPATDFTVVRQKLKEGAIEGTTQNHVAEGVVAKGAKATHEFAVDPHRDTIIVAICEDATCSDVNVVGSDSTGTFVTPDRSGGSRAIITLFADSIASKKLNVEVSMPGCKHEACAYALSVSSRPRAYPAE